MTEQPTLLYPVPFTEADQERLVGFSCGEYVWSRCAREWICGSDVFDSIKRGTQVWIFETEGGEVVGFGSVGISQWRWPPPDGSPTTVVLIPMLGIDTRYQGRPRDREQRFSYRIMGHLIAQAKNIASQAASPPNWVVLQVHRENEHAIRFYENCGFELIPGVVRRNDHLVMKLWIGETED